MGQEPPEGRATTGCLGYFVLLFTAALIAGSTLTLQGAGWALQELYLILGEPVPTIIWPAVSWLNAAAVWLLSIPLSMAGRQSGFGAIRRTWMVAAAFLFVLGFVRLLPGTMTQAAMMVQIALAALLSLILARSTRGRATETAAQATGLSPAIAVAPAAALPWALLGALGSPIDTLLAILAGAGIGIYGGLLLERFLFRKLAETTSSGGEKLVLGSIGAAVALAILGGGFGFGGSQLLLLAALPPLGLGVAVLGLRLFRPGAADHRAWQSIGVMVGAVAAAPLAFFDPDELTLLLAVDDVLGWAALASLLALIGGTIASAGLWLIARRRQGRGNDRYVLAGAPWLAILVAYLALGQPGFYGERLFVILEEQAKLPEVQSVEGREARAEVVYRTLVQQAESTQHQLRSDMDRLGLQYRPYYLVNGLEVDGGPLVRLWLSSRPEVDRVLESPRLRPLPRPSPPPTGDASAPEAAQWNVTSIGADRVWNELGVRGAGITVAILDSGVQGDHPALAAGFRGLGGRDDYSWLDPWNDAATPTDIGGHGTHVTGSVLGRGGIGIAPEAEWFACVNLARNLGNPALYLDCMQFALAPYPRDGDPFVDGEPSLAAHVTNNSWGCPPFEGCDQTSLEPAVAALRDAGIFVVAAAGNQGPGCGSVIDPIAIYPTAFTVGAVDRFGDIAPFSSRGPVRGEDGLRMKPDIVAPGVDVLSSFPNSSFREESGTSMAGPQVAGVVALMWSAQPRLIGDIDRTERLLTETARPYLGEREGCFAGEDPNAAYGYGIVDAYGAVRAAMALE